MPTKRTGRGAVQVRVIGGRMGDPRLRESRRQGLAGENSVGSEGEHEEVVRLDRNSVPLANRRVEDEEPAGPVDERKSKRKMGLRGLTVLMSVGAIFLAVGVVLGVGALRDDSPPPKLAIDSMKAVDRPNEAEAEADRIEGLIRDAAVVFEKYCAAKSVDEVLDLVRRSEKLKSILDKKWKPLGPLENLNQEAAERDGEYSVEISGVSQNGETVRLVMVPSSEGMKLDWEASCGIGDVEFNQLKLLEVGAGANMRLVVKPETFHPLDFPDSEFRCYRLRSLENEGDLFGYARIGSEVAQSLAEEFNEGSVLLANEFELPMILRLENTGAGEFGQFEISDLLQIGWIEHE